MKNKNFKKLFCVMLSVSTLISSCAGAVSTESATKKINFEKVKKVAKDAAPWLAVGVPTVGFLVLGAVLLSKSLPKSSTKNPQLGSDDDKDISTTAVPSSPVQQKIPQALPAPTSHQVNGNKPVEKSISGSSAASANVSVVAPVSVPVIKLDSTLPKGGLTEGSIDECIRRGELPGIKFYFIKNRVFSDYVVYIITNAEHADMYFKFIGASINEIGTIKKNQNRIIYQNDVLTGKDHTINAVFGTSSRFASDFSKIVKKMKSDVVSHYINLGASDNSAKLDMPVIRSVAVAEKLGMAKQFIKELEKPGEKKEPKKEEPVVESDVGEDDKEMSALHDSDGAVGNEEKRRLEESKRGEMEFSKKQGIIKGVKLYRYSSEKPDLMHPIASRSTAHYYWITNYDDVMNAGYDKDELVKIVAYQGRWSYKKNLVSTKGFFGRFANKWGMSELFDFEKKDSFGRLFDEITRDLEVGERMGSKTLEVLPAGVPINEYGAHVSEGFDEAIHDAFCPGLSAILEKQYSNPEALRSDVEKLLQEKGKI